MLKRCVIPDCSLEGDFSEFFRFPSDYNLLDQWISKLPLLNIASLNFKSAEICEHHFNPKELKEGEGFAKKLEENAVPEYFPINEEIDWECCRFCLKKLTGGQLPLDDLVKSHYQNLMQEELNMDFPQTFSCADCFHAIRNSSHIKTKIQENQLRLSNFSPKLKSSEFLEIKMEKIQSDNDEEADFDQEFQDEKVENFNLYNEDCLVTRRRSKSKNQRSKGRKKNSENNASTKHTRERPFQSEFPQCEKSYFSKKNLVMHVNMIHSTGSYPCSDCDEVLTSQTMLRFHQRKKHKKLVRNVNIPELERKSGRGVCSICDRFYDNLPNHHRRIHERKRNYECDNCAIRCFSKNEMESHMKVHQKYRERKFTCEICFNQFLSRSSLRSHVEKYHLKKGLIYCEFCAQSFSTRNFYESHIRAKHTGERAFKCELCDKAYFSNGDLSKHVKSNHSTETVSCQFCVGKFFKSNHHLRHHIRVKHSERKFVCEYENCGQKFSENYNLKKHVKNFHLGIREHQCKTCLASFVQKNKLDRHILSIHMNVKFACEIWNCKSQFARKETYRSHVLSHHKDLGEENVQILLEKIKKLEVPKVLNN